MNNQNDLSVFLNWLADRLVNVYGEPENIDYVLACRRYAAQQAQPVQQPLAQAIKNAPEFNMNGYDDDDVRRLHDWAVSLVHLADAQQAQPAQKVSEKFIDALIRSICEIPDRNSPEDFPEAMVVTPDELHQCIREVEESFADAQQAQPPVERGPWSVEHEGHNVALLSDDFTHDVSLHVSGDFADTEQKIAYATELARRLNNAQQAQPAAEIYDEALCHAAFYVRDHCQDGEHHADVIAALKKPVRYLDAQQAQPADISDEVADHLSQCAADPNLLERANDMPDYGGSLIVEVASAQPASGERNE